MMSLRLWILYFAVLVALWLLVYASACFVDRLEQKRRALSAIAYQRQRNLARLERNVLKAERIVRELAIEIERRRQEKKKAEAATSARTHFH